MADILHRVRVPAPPERVYAALTQADEVRRWWTPDVALDEHVGGAGRFGFGGARVKTSRIEALGPSRRVVWAVTSCFLPEWRGTRIAFALQDEGDATILHLAHTGFPDGCGCLAMCTTGWATYLEQVRRLCEGLAQPVASSPIVVYSSREARSGARSWPRWKRRARLTAWRP